MHEIVAIALQDSVVLDLGIPHQVFGTARGAAGEELYRVRIASVDGAPIRTTAGFDAAVADGLEIVDEADTVIVLPGREARTGPIDPRVRRAVLGARDRGARIMAICTGAFVLAELGLLDGRRATTYWMRSAEFEERFPLVRLEPDVLYVDDGILTSAGVAAGLDLCLHVVRSDHGMTVANDVARRLVMPPIRFGGQSQYIERPRPADEGDRFSELLEWARAHLASDLSLPRLARRAALSERTLARRFRERTGSSPGAWLAAERLDRARELLESTDLTVKEIAAASGLGSAANLRSRFSQRFGLAPGDYRRSFRPAPLSA
ncbi:GlxA family transcriptional regulator [Salinibacterium soli]|uniref:Helix-turn-helix domain-containing protein n=1 Tax=Antiquaquibacter soli TaxID=3064523 RepID=A0ABT9BQS5_9MICO|nr:helix-turn-helix domain-containing protein [Protaetiibacter sp. WY-16]MDO7881667.1 helix-turn-helix domain-containing protein [Protaetiibacter sp. WY-16]